MLLDILHILSVLYIYIEATIHAVQTHIAVIPAIF